MSPAGGRAQVQRVGKDAAPQADICSRVRSFAANDPDRLFCRVISGGQSHDLTYGALLDTAQRYAAVYLERGVGQGDVVLIILPHGIDLFPAFLGALLIGALPSFLPFLTPKQQPDLYWATHAALFSRIGARLLVTWGQNLASMQTALPGFSISVHLAEDTPASGNAAPIAAREHAGPAFLQHSSGTTGLKKGVVITHEALCAQVQAYAKAIELNDRDRIATWLPLYHDMGLVSCFLMPAMLGTPVYAMDPFEWVLKPATLLDTIEKYRCSLAWLPNFAFHHLCGPGAAGKGWDLECVRALIDCSEPCKPETFEQFERQFGEMGIGPGKLLTCYALAENVFAAAQSRAGSAARVVLADRRAFYEQHKIEASGEGRDALQFLSCGSAIDGVEIEVRDSNGAKLPDGCVGEIAIAGTSLFRGYYMNPDETAARLAQGWYHTRDLGFILEGELYVTGRVDDLLIVHGVNYYAHDIEFAVNQVAGVITGRCVAVGEYRADAGTTEVIVLAETESPGHSQIADLRRAVKLKVLSATGLLVQQVGIVDRGWLVKTTSGKISRSENLKRFRDTKKMEIGKS